MKPSAPGEWPILRQAKPMFRCTTRAATHAWVNQGCSKHAQHCYGESPPLALGEKRQRASKASDDISISFR